MGLPGSAAAGSVGAGVLVGDGAIAEFAVKVVGIYFGINGKTHGDCESAELVGVSEVGRESGELEHEACLAVALSVAQPEDMYEIRWKLRMDVPIPLSCEWTSSCGHPAQSRAFTDSPRVGATNSDRIAVVQPRSSTCHILSAWP